MQIAKGFLLQGKRVLFVSAEEGAERARERGERLGVLDDELLVCTATKLCNVLKALNETKADVLLLDSIQRIHDDKLASLAGSSQQIRHVCERLLNEKNKKVTLFVVGHVTKDGKLAGPKVLEHLVDVVLHFALDEGDERLLSTRKNRFGPCCEASLLMTEAGFVARREY
ncbi:MAG: hypothetical protein GY822_02135 [Deltaproteobacteria bacterium]|nr:hypothetical protein [Deltaproteobacteria bacterium]